MPAIEVIEAPKKLTEAKAQKLSDRIQDQCVKVDAEQGVLRGFLLSFYDGKGFAALGHKKWEDWATTVMPGHRSSLYRQLSAGQHERALQMEVGSTPESHLRDLGKVSPDQRQDVINMADKAAAAEGRERQASDVKDAIAAVRTPGKPKKADQPKDMTGTVIPSKLRIIFEEGKAPFDEALRMLSQLSTLVGEMATGKASKHVGPQLEAIEQNRAAMYGTIKFCRPFAVSEDGKSWLNEKEWRESPAGKASADKVEVQPKAKKGTPTAKKATRRPKK